MTSAVVIHSRETSERSRAVEGRRGPAALVATLFLEG